MAIDRIKKLTIVCRVSAVQRIMRALHELNAVEVTDTMEQLTDADGKLQRHELAARESEESLSQCTFILSLLDMFAPVKKGFFEGLTPLPIVVEPNELDTTVHSFDLDAAFETARQLDEENRLVDREITDIQNKIKELAPLEDVPFALADLTRPKHIHVVLGTIPSMNLRAFSRDAAFENRVTWELVKPCVQMRKEALKSPDVSSVELPDSKQSVRVLFACLKHDENEVRKALSAYGFDEIALPPLPGKVRDHVRELSEDLATRHTRQQEIRKKVLDVSTSRRSVEVLCAHWDSVRRKEAAIEYGVMGKWTHVLTGYIREADVPRMQDVFQKEFSDASLLLADPAPDEQPPVSISLPKFVQPIQMLVNLFGLPNYHTFDPSPFIMVNFLVFFGICFGDVAYGAMLLALGLYLASKTRAFKGVNSFVRLLAYAGASTMVFGALTGTWFGDLYKAEYLGENNLLLRLQQTFVVFDTMAKPVVALVVALLIGMLNQFYGIALKMYGSVKSGDITAAVCDGLFWLIALPGMVILISQMFVEVPGFLRITAMVLFGLGCTGLVLTQGRNEPTMAGKVVTGVVSLYGIVGSYGCTAFIGDTLSYSRLLALGITGSIVGQSMNMMALMVKEVPYVGLILFIGFLIVGHVFNFLISVLGAFIHAMRLIFVEFFGRFYQGGARPFSPLGFDSDTALLKRSS